MYTMSKEEFVDKYIKDIAEKKRQKNKMLAEYFYFRKNERPWGIRGVIK